MNRLVWLFRESAAVALHWWPPTLALSLLVAIALTVSAVRHSADLRAKGGYVLLALVPPVAIVLVGWLFEAVPALGWTIYIFILAEVGITLTLIWKLTGLRLLGAAVGGLGLWLSLCSSFIAGMSIANDWV